MKIIMIFLCLAMLFGCRPMHEYWNPEYQRWEKEFHQRSEQGQRVPEKEIKKTISYCLKYQDALSVGYAQSLAIPICYSIDYNPYYGWRLPDNACWIYERGKPNYFWQSIHKRQECVCYPHSDFLTPDNTCRVWDNRKDVRPPL